MGQSTNPAEALILTGTSRQMVVRLALPAMFALFLSGLNQYIDGVYIAQMEGELALAGVALAFPLTLIGAGIGNLVGTGAATVLSVAIGARDLRRQARVFNTAALTAIVLGAATGAVTWALTDELVALAGGRGDVAAEAATYFEVIAIGTVATALGYTGNFLVRGEGKMLHSLAMTGSVVAVNLVFTPLFIWAWGVAGAAWATNLSIAIYFVAAWAYYWRGHGSFAIDLGYRGLDLQIVREILTMGVAGMVVVMMGLAQQIVAIHTISSLGGAREIAVFGAAFRLMFLLMCPTIGLMRATQPIFGINYGAGQRARVRRLFVEMTLWGTAIVAVLWLPAFLAPRAAMGVMLPETTLTAIEVRDARVFVTAVLGLPLMFNALALLPAIGRAGLAAGLAIARQVALFVPALLLLAAAIGASGVYLAWFGVDVLVTGVCAVAVASVLRRDLR